MSNEAGSSGTEQNDAATCQQIGTQTTRDGSRPVRYELIDKNGDLVEEFATAQTAAEYAKRRWPDQEQDEDRTGAGWDIQIAGAK